MTKLIDNSGGFNNNVWSFAVYFSVIDSTKTRVASKFQEFSKKLSCHCILFVSFPYLCNPKIKLIMANHSATKKDVRQSRKRNERNRYYGKTTRNAIRDLKAIEEKGAAAKELPSVASMIDKLAKRGTIHKNKAK
jgi:small subunit ribosomal protein S20